MIFSYIDVFVRLMILGCLRIKARTIAEDNGFREVVTYVQGKVAVRAWGGASARTSGSDLFQMNLTCLHHMLFG